MGQGHGKGEAIREKASPSHNRVQEGAKPYSADRGGVITLATEVGSKEQKLIFTAGKRPKT